MNDKKELLKLITKSIVALDEFINLNGIPKNHGLAKDGMRVLLLLRNEVLKEGEDINIRVLRAFKDICTYVSLQYEDTAFYVPLFEVYNYLSNTLQYFEGLELLRGDFDKGNPI
jgi:hypothetical protein